jgi:hypothetical protein
MATVEIEQPTTYYKPDGTAVLIQPGQPVDSSWTTAPMSTVSGSMSTEPVMSTGTTQAPQTPANMTVAPLPTVPAPMGTTAPTGTTGTAAPAGTTGVQATLINAQGQKVVVTSGSQEAQNYFSQGYMLMGPDGKPVAQTGATGTPPPGGAGTPPPGLDDTQLAAYLKSIGRSPTDYTGVTKNPDGTWNVSGAPKPTDGLASPADLENQHTEDYKRLQQEAIDKQLDFQKQYDDIQNGVIPLSPEDNAQLDSIRQSIARQTREQQRVNDSVLRSMRMMGFRSGRTMFAAEIETGIEKHEIDNGLQRIRDIEIQGAALIAQAKAAIKSKNMQGLQDKMNMFDKLQEMKSNQILTLLKLEQDVEARQAAKLKAVQDKQKDLIALSKDLAPGLSYSLLKLDDKGNIQMPTADEITSAAEKAGISPLILQEELYNSRKSLEGQALDERKKQLEIFKLEHPVIRIGKGAYTYDASGNLVSLGISGGTSSTGGTSSGGSYTGEFTQAQIMDPTVQAWADKVESEGVSVYTQIPKYLQDKVKQATLQRQQVMSLAPGADIFSAQLGSAVNLTTTQKQKLIGAGLTEKDLPQIQADISQYGLEAAIEGLDEVQQKVIKSIYGTTTSASSTSKEMSTEEFIKILQTPSTP